MASIIQRAQKLSGPGGREGGGGERRTEVELRGTQAHRNHDGIGQPWIKSLKSHIIHHLSY